MNFEYSYGATPISHDELMDLIPGHLQTQDELNEWEQRNIIEAQKWAFFKKHKNITTIKFCCELHQRMFNHTWKWAGKFRHSNKNIGVAWEQVSTQLKLVLDDVQYQLANDTYQLDEIAMRLHHRLVSVHPFPNGNGRHARLYTDVFLANQKAKKFTWGMYAPEDSTVIRKMYINALREADKGNYKLLSDFVRS